MKVYVVGWTTTCQSMDESSASSGVYGVYGSESKALVALDKCMDEMYREAINWEEDPVNREKIEDSIEKYKMSTTKRNIEYTNPCDDTINIDIEIFETEFALEDM